VLNGMKSIGKPTNGNFTLGNTFSNLIQGFAILNGSTCTGKL